MSFRNQNYIGWRKLEVGLTRALRGIKTVPNPYGFFQMAFGLIVICTTLVWMLADRQAVAQALGEMLRR